MSQRSLAILQSLRTFAFLALFSPAVLAADNFPTLIDLPNGWLPEGIDTGRGPILYSGSRATGGVYAVDLRTGDGTFVVPAQEGRVAVGVAVDERTNYIFVAGGPTGDGYVYDANTGASLAAYALTTEGATFINDVVLTTDAVYFTESNQAVIYRVPLDSGGGLLPDATAEAIPLTGDWEQVTGLNANGIEATPDGSALLVINSASGVLYQVDSATGVATAIDLGGASLTLGDGMLVQGNTLYVVRNRANEIVVIDLDADLSAGTVVDVITNPSFDIPTTMASFGGRLYAVNARFSTPPTPDTAYQIVGFSR